MRRNPEPVRRAAEPAAGGDGSRDPETSPLYPGWRVVLACFIMAIFCWGFGFYGQGIYLAELHRLHRWPASLISAASTMFYLFGAFLVVFVSDAVGRLGPRLFVLLGALCMAAAMALLSIITAPWQLYAAYGVMSFGWAAMSVGSITNVLGLWFHSRRGLAISLALNGASCGGIVVVPALTYLIGRAGFADSMLIAPLIMLAVLVPTLLLCIPRSPPQPGIDADTAAGVPRPATWTRALALRDLNFWTVVAPFALALVAQVGFLVHQISFLEPKIGAADAALAVAVTAIAAAAGRLVLGAVIDRLNQRLITAVLLASQAAALLVMTHSAGAMVLFTACGVFGLSVGNLITLPALIIQREFDAASFGMLIGLSTAIGQFIYASGPGLLGVVRDLTGGYTAALYLCVALELIAAVIILTPARRRIVGTA